MNKICLTSRGSGVRIRQRPLENEGLTRNRESFLFYRDTQFAHNLKNRWVADKTWFGKKQM
jgi:hypothetical protein